MEHHVTAHCSGSVRNLSVRAGSACSVGAVICDIQPVSEVIMGHHAPTAEE